MSPRDDTGINKQLGAQESAFIPNRDKRAEATGLWEPAHTVVFVGPEHRHFVLGSAKLAQRVVFIKVLFFIIIFFAKYEGVIFLLPVPHTRFPQCCCSQVRYWGSLCQHGQNWARLENTAFKVQSFPSCRLCTFPL